MAKERLSIRTIKEVLRLHFEHRQWAQLIAKSCSIARGTVQKYLHRAQRAALPSSLPAEMADTALENRFFSAIPSIPPKTPDASFGVFSQ